MTAKLQRAAIGKGTVQSAKFGSVSGQVTSADLLRDVVFTGAALTCLYQSPGESCEAK